MYRTAFRMGAAGALLLCLFGGSAVAQTGLGTVKGTVLDPSRSAISGAKATLTNQDTNIARNAESSNVGIFYFGEIPPGRYTLAIEAPGFKKWSGTLVLQVGQTAVIDPMLDVGSVDTVVEVQDVAPVITTEGMGVANVKDSLRIHQLPLNGRDITNLFNLTPGVEGGGTPRVNGSKVGATEILQDGISMVDRFGGGVIRIRPSLDSVEEFRLETNGSSAKFSHPATAVLVTKSGTNSIHGTFFETFRNNAAGLRSRQRQDGNTPALLIRNEFGASAGGPVYIPHVYNGKNRSFWFFSYEGLRQRQKTFDQDYVPTPAMWNGDFSQMFDNNNVQTHIFDPLTTDAKGLRQAFPNDLIPQARLSAFYGTMHAITHLPTSAINPFQDINMQTFYPVKQNNDTYTIRGDQRLSDKDSLSGRFTRSQLTSAQTGGRFGSPNENMPNPFGSSRGNTRVYSTTITYTRTFKPNLINELQVGNTRNPNGQGTLADFFPWANQLGLPNPFGVTGWPTISVGGADPFGWDADNHKDQNLTAYQIQDNATWVRGKHTIQFGGQIRREENNVQELQQAQGSHTFGSAWTAQYDPTGDQAVPFTGSGLASMALGIPTFLSDQFNRGFFYFQQSNAGLYVQDNWKVTPRLTLDLGLRWEKWTPYHEKLNRLVNVDLNTFASQFQVITPDSVTMESLRGVPPTVLTSWANRGLTWKTATQANFPSALTPAVNHDFGPRLGAAYRVTNKTVVRGGYGIYYWTMPLSQILQTSRTNPPLNLRYTNQIGSFDGTSSFAIRTVPRSDFFIGKATVDTNGVITLPTTAQSIMPWDVRDWTDDRMQAWHFTIEREIMKDTVFRINYIGNRGDHLEQRFNLNTQEGQFNYVARTGQNVPSFRDALRVNPNWSFSAANHTGYSNTHSFQAEVERRYSNGLAFQWFYVFTRSLNTTDAGGSTSGNGNINDTSGTPAVPENINILGEPNMTYDQRLRLVYYNSTAIPAHHVRWNGVYDLPFGRGKRFAGSASRALNTVIGGWQLATIGDWRSGNWLSVSSGEYFFSDPTLSADQRLALYLNGAPRRLWFKGDFDPTRATGVDQAALQKLVPTDRSQRAIHPLGSGFNNQIPQLLTNGTVRQTSITDTVNWNPRAFFKGPGAWNVDGSVFKNVSLTEAVKLRVTADFFNMLNHPNDPNPDGSTGLQNLSVQPNEPRIIQFSLRLQF
jgi:hypothetical protein